MIVLHDLLTGLTHIETVVAEHTVHNHQLLVVDLQDIADAERILEHLLRIELLAEVDVTDAQTVVRCSIEELTDILTRDDVALCQ